MSLIIGDNFNFRGRKPLDNRIVVDDLSILTGIQESDLYNGILVYVSSEKKYYVYNSNNDVDPIFNKWRELSTSGINTKTAIIDSVETNPTYGHLILTLSDGTTIDCGNAMGIQGPKGDGFAISRIYENLSDILSETNPVEEGAMIALIETDSGTGEINAKIYIRHTGTQMDIQNLENYIYFCDLADATVIRGPEGPQGLKGDKGDTPVVSIAPIAATDTTPAGQKITFTTVTTTIGADENPVQSTTKVEYSIYNGADGIHVKNATINTNNELIFTMSDNTTINAGIIKGNGTSSADSHSYIIILGVYGNNNKPTIFNKDDIYYNTDTKLIYHASSNNVWDAGSNPKENTLYISINDKKIYSYINGSFNFYGGGNIELSAKDKNALTVEQDGLYVEDLSQKVNQINIAQNTVNEALDHAEFKLAGNTSVSTVGQLIPFTKLIDGNMKLNESNHISLKANHSYQIICILCYQDTSKSSFANIEYAFVDDSNNKIIQLFQPYKGDSKFEFSSTIAFQYTPTRDCGLYMKTVNVYNVDIIEQGKTTLTIQEIGRTITIDPINYIDTTQGIQDVPVGTLINTEGPQNPDHYLLCDGAEYNIADYRDLAEVIKKMYGKYNYFGGDGISTFAVPKYVDTNKWFSPKQTNNSNPYNVSASSVYSDWPVWWGFNNSCTTSANNAWHSAVGLTTGYWVQIDFKAIKPLMGISMAPRPESNYNISRMPRDFDIMGSNDGTTWNVIKSYTGINDYENYKYREFIFDRPEKYRYYRIANIVITGNCVNIADIHFLEAPEKYVYIKYQPTYFIGNITGFEETVELLDTPKEYRLEVNKEVMFNDKITLKQPITNFDYLEVITDTHHSSGSYTYPRVDKIYVKDIQYQPDDNTWGYDTVLSYELMPLFGNNANHTGCFGLAYNFKDANTLRMLSSRCIRLDNGTAWETRRIKAIKGIKKTYNI